MSDRLKGKVALITGAGTGIGRAAAILFATEGASISGCDLNAEAIEETARLVQDTGGIMHWRAPVDLEDPDQAAGWVDEAASHFGRVDILYNNAGRFPATSFEAGTIEKYRAALKGEVDVVYFPTHAAWRHMKAAGGGSIINTSSITAHRTNGTHLSGHGIGKGAVASFAPHLAFEGGPLGIRVNTLSPGLTRTPQTEMFITEKDIERTPLRRLGTPEEIAEVALFLASDESRFMTGANVVVDGGQSLVMPANR